MSKETKILSAEEVVEALESLTGWKLQKDIISKQFEFKGFPEAVEFINDLVPFLQEINHHPDIKISYNKIEFELTSHDLGNKLTKNDILVAKEIEKKLKNNSLI